MFKNGDSNHLMHLIRDSTFILVIPCLIWQFISLNFDRKNDFTFAPCSSTVPGTSDRISCEYSLYFCSPDHSPRKHTPVVPKISFLMGSFHLQGSPSIHLVIHSSILLSVSEHPSIKTLVNNPVCRKDNSCEEQGCPMAQASMDSQSDREGKHKV